MLCSSDRAWTKAVILQPQLELFTSFFYSVGIRQIFDESDVMGIGIIKLMLLATQIMLGTFPRFFCVMLKALLA